MGENVITISHSMSVSRSLSWSQKLIDVTVYVTSLKLSFIDVTVYVTSKIASENMSLLA